MARVLTVDDSRAIRMIVCKHVEELGFSVDEAEDGEQALEKMRNEHYDVVLLDVTMPVLDGPSMLARLRENGDRTPVVMLTSEAKRSIVASLVRLGIDDYIVKPFKPDQLTAKIMKAIKSSDQGASATGSFRAAAPPAAAPAASPKAPGRESDSKGADVLVVDDMENVPKRLRALLPDNVTMESALTAQAALSACKDKTYKVILIDHDLPEVASASLIKPLRLLQPQAVILALALRSNNKVSDEAREVGFDGVVFKPFDPSNLAEMLLRHFESKEVIFAEENIIRVAPFAGKESAADRYFGQLAAALVPQVEAVADACFGEIIVDLSQAPPFPGRLTRILAEMDARSRHMGMQLRLVGTAEMAKVLKQVQETATIPFFGTVDEAVQFRAA